MHIVLIHNDMKTLKKLMNHVKKVYPDNKLVAFNDSELALRYIRDRAETVKICFTSVIMPKVTGFGITDELKTLNKKAKVVFLADTDEYATEAWLHSVSDYLLTPITQNCIERTMTSCTAVAIGV